MTAAIYERDAAPGGYIHPRAWCLIDLEAIRHNAAVLRARADAPLIAMVKADAYGLGAEAVARALGAPFDDTTPRAFAAPSDNPDASARESLAHRHATPSAHIPWALGVATVHEGVALRNVGYTGRVLVTSPLLRDELVAVADAKLIPSLHTPDQITAWAATTRQPWHLSIDTGMNRAGVPWTDVMSLRNVVAHHPPQGAYTHFHSALHSDESRDLQLSRFRQALHALSLPAGTLLHAENSGALVAKHASESNWNLSRPGIALYGSPSHALYNLRAVLHVYARVVDIRDVSVGESVSYDATWTAARPTRIATVAIGYGDGYRRALSGVGHMLLHGQRVPVTGVVTMDLTMLDVTDVSCEVGDIATVLGAPYAAPDVKHPEHGDQLLTVDEVAAMGGLSPYELLVGWRLRLPRVYREST